jgi:hypothetical protein
MAITNTQLAAACGSGDLVLTLRDTTSGFPAVGVVANQPLRIDGEWMFLVSTLAIGAPGSVKVRSRGAEGTAAVPHDVLAPVSTSGTPGDFSQPSSPTISGNAPSVDATVNIGQDETIIPPLVDTVYFINKASAAAITITSPASGNPAVEMTFVSTTAFQHTITYTPGFGASGASTDVATFSGVLPNLLKVVVGPAGQLYAGASVGVTIA